MTKAKILEVATSLYLADMQLYEAHAKEAKQEHLIAGLWNHQQALICAAEMGAIAMMVDALGVMYHDEFVRHVHDQIAAEQAEVAM